MASDTQKMRKIVSLHGLLQPILRQKLRTWTDKEGVAARGTCASMGLSCYQKSKLFAFTRCPFHTYSQQKGHGNVTLSTAMNKPGVQAEASGESGLPLSCEGVTRRRPFAFLWYLKCLPTSVWCFLRGRTGTKCKVLLLSTVSYPCGSFTKRIFVYTEDEMLRMKRP